MTIHLMIRQAFVESGLSKAELARRAKVTRPNLIRYLATGTGISIDAAERILAELVAEIRSKSSPKNTTAPIDAER